MTALHRPVWTAADAARDWRVPTPDAGALDFHRSLSGYAPTALVEMPELARSLGVGRVFVKDESNRFGLPAFKILGASWAIERALSGCSGDVTTLVTATDGNHGRAIARVAAQRGLSARIFIPAGVPSPAIAAIVDEGASVVRVEDSYDAAVAAAAADADSSGALLVQDTSWPGYVRIPAWIVEGYATMFGELDEQLAGAGAGAVELLAVPVGVGSLAQAAIAHYRRPDLSEAPALLCVEPDRAACVLRSLQQDEPVTVETSATIMSGLNCGTVSSTAWPYLRFGVDAAVAVGDRETRAAARDLADLGVAVGPCGAATLAGSRLALADSRRRAHLGVSATSTVVLISTESSTANPIDTSITVQL